LLGNKPYHQQVSCYEQTESSREKTNIPNITLISIQRAGPVQTVRPAESKGGGRRGPRLHPQDRPGRPGDRGGFLHLPQHGRAVAIDEDPERGRPIAITAEQTANRTRSGPDQAKADVASAKAGAEKASGEVAGLRTQLDQAKRQAAEAKAGADKTAAQVTQLQAQLAALARAQAQAATPEPAKPAEAGQTAPVKPAVSSLKKMPLNASFKKAPMLDGNALLIQNTSTASLSLTVKFSNPSGSKEFPVTLEPGAVKEMGWLGAWVLAAGDKVEITSPGCDTIQKTAP
jgi:hypothetical protein